MRNLLFAWSKAILSVWKREAGALKSSSDMRIHINQTDSESVKSVVDKCQEDKMCIRDRSAGVGAGPPRSAG